MPVIMMVLVVILSVVLISNLYQKYWSYGLEAEVHFTDSEVTERDKGFLEEKITNLKWVPLPILTIKFALDRNITYEQKENTAKTDKQYRSDSLDLLPYQRITRKFPITYEKRGYYEINSMDLVATDFFFRGILVKEIPLQQVIYVYPASFLQAPLQAAFTRMMGEYRSRRFLYEDPFSMRGIRNYTGREPMKQINWAATAKTGDLKVKEYEDTTGEEVTIFLNLETEGIWLYETLFEACIRMCRTYLEWFLSQGIPIQVVTNGIDIVTGERIKIEIGAGASHLTRCLQQLARIDLHKTLDTHKERMFARFFTEHQAKAGALSILLSVDQSEQLSQAYANYLGRTGIGEWIIAVHEDMEHRKLFTTAHTTFVEVER